MNAEKLNAHLLMFLILLSALLIIGMLYLSEILSIAYGIGAGALIQARNESIVRSLAGTVANIGALKRSVEEMFVLTGIAITSLLLSIGAYLNRRGRPKTARTYFFSHLFVVMLLALLVFTVYSSFGPIGNSLIEAGIYAGIFIAIAIDAVEITFYRSQKKPQVSKTVAIEPETPFGNILRLKEIFLSFTGRLRIVDKHVNSKALENLYRLIEESKSITGIDIITSAELLDSRFNQNLNDLKKELKNKGIELELMIMSDADATMQHERFAFDDSIAIKLPPLNIINEKSEHVTRIRLSDAKERFEELKKNAIKYENYLIKKAHEQGASS